jgi:uncharacterized surface anchored protein
MVFAREWELDDFLLNFEELTKIFYYPKQRWHFLRKRLEHIGIEQSKCEKIRKIFVENVIIAKHLGNRSGNIKEEAKKMILLADKTIDMSYLFKYGITAYKIGSLISPFLLEDKK